MTECHIDRVPAHVLVKILQNIEHAEISKLSGISRQWRELCVTNSLWKDVVFEGKNRVSLKQLTSFLHSPYSRGVENISIEGYVIRRPETGSQSAITNYILNVIGRKMINLKSLRLWNANICCLNIKNFPKRLVSLSLEGCIVECDFLSSLCKREVLPKLKHLDLSYVHNISSCGASFKAILLKKGLETIQLRHCHRIGNHELSHLAQMPSLKVLNLSEIASVNDSVLKCLCKSRLLTELRLAFTVVSDAGLSFFSRNGPSSLRLLDIRGCPKVSATTLYELHSNMNLNEVWISGKMEGAEEARKALRTPKILDEVDLNKMAIALDLSIYSAHFADVLKQSPEEVDVVEANLPIRADYLGL